MLNKIQFSLFFLILFFMISCTGDKRVNEKDMENPKTLPDQEQKEDTLSVKEF